MIQASSELFFLPLPSSIPPELMPMLGHLLGTDLHTLSRLTWGELVSCPPDLGTLVGHFTLGSAHLVCASVCVCVYCCAICVPLSLELHSWAHYSGDIKDAIFMDCCMIPKNE